MSERETYIPVFDDKGERVGIIDPTRSGLVSGTFYAASMKGKKFDGVFDSFEDAKAYLLKIGV